MPPQLATDNWSNALRLVSIGRKLQARRRKLLVSLFAPRIKLKRNKEFSTPCLQFTLNGNQP